MKDEAGALSFVLGALSFVGSAKNKAQSTKLLLHPSSFRHHPF
jgi:hypothetical protein